MTAMQSAPKPHPAAAIDWDALDALKYQDEDAAVAALLADAAARRRRARQRRRRGARAGARARAT